MLSSSPFNKWDWEASLKQPTQDSLDVAARIMDEASQSLAKSVSQRTLLGNETVTWNILDRAWALVVDNLTDERFNLTLVRFTRNLVAQNPNNQRTAFHLLSAVCSLVQALTSFHAIDNPDSIPLLRASIQLLSNMVTSNTDLCKDFWRSKIICPEEGNIVLRILQSKDVGTTHTTFILLLNIIMAYPDAVTDVHNPAFRKVTVRLLDKLEWLSEQDECDSDSKVFGIGYQIFETLFDHDGLIPLWEILRVDGTVIAPSQINLLKVLDAYTQTILKQPDRKPPSIASLIPDFFALCDFSVQSIRRFLQGQTTGKPISSTSDSIMEVDNLLPRVSQAIILLAQCSNAIALYEIESSIHHDSGHTPSLLATLKSWIPQDTAQTTGLIEMLIELLRQLHLFLPRIAFGKPLQTSDIAAQQVDRTGFNYLKRDLIRLVGVMVHNDVMMQDRTRECGGIEVTLNMCTPDERNPYLREHALLALRNILAGNLSNQEIVDAMKPSGYWDKDGVLRDISVLKTRPGE